MKVAFVTDSSCGIHPNVMKEKGIISLPLQIVVPNQENALLDFIDAPLEVIYENIEKGILMSTSIPPLGLIEKTFKELKDEGYEAVFCIPINPGLSSCYNALRLAAEEVGLEYIHVDIYTTAIFQEYCITRAKEMYDAGMEINEIKEIIEKNAKTCSTFIVPNSLDQLKRGGRLTPLAATLAGLLKIKPILKIDASCEGKIDVYEKIRTMGKAMDKVVADLKEKGVDDTYKICIAHSNGIENAELMKRKLLLIFPNHEIEIVPLVSVISVHVGLDCIGVQTFKKF